jgi:hypothetical protein
VPGGIEVHPESVPSRLAWLYRMSRCAQCQHLRFDRLDIFDGHVEVELLRSLAGRPRRRCELRGLLKSESQPIDGEDDPVVLGEGDFPADDAPVELSKRSGIWAIQDDGAHAGERHGQAVFHERHAGSADTRWTN